MLKVAFKDSEIIFIDGDHSYDAVKLDIKSWSPKLKNDGIICGHIHKAEIRYINNIEYLNCGDWVESCTALVETYDGEFEIISWLEDDFQNKKQE